MGALSEETDWTGCLLAYLFVAVLFVAAVAAGGWAGWALTRQRWGAVVGAAAVPFVLRLIGAAGRRR